MLPVVQKAQPDKHWQGKTALVTGGASGIGAAIVLELLLAGVKVAVVDRQPPVNRPPETTDKQCKYFSADVSSFRDAQLLTAETCELFGGLDIVINNAGINRDKTIWNLEEADWDEVINVNLKGCFNYCRAAAPVMREQCGGKIVNISSINGIRGKFGQANYAASKAGVLGLTKTLARELGKYNINVNAVAPGFIKTPMTDALPESAVESAAKETALQRIGEPEDVARVVLFLCSDLARHITGQIIQVDGGQLI